MTAEILCFAAATRPTMTLSSARVTPLKDSPPLLKRYKGVKNSPRAMGERKTPTRKRAIGICMATETRVTGQGTEPQ